ncbi:PHO85 cyclin-5 [Entomophthora muscae]|uniref:PHO85 cyclin-5 n=1 Tax=Entomophthora muscae TaxID=34485 RepID=A0ACC2RGT2_9FUNG|nr:PHO85 cyclin-5 [Entomophthora muscae]
MARSLGTLTVLSMAAIKDTWGLAIDREMNGNSYSLKSFLDTVNCRFVTSPQVVYMAILYCQRLKHDIQQRMLARVQMVPKPPWTAIFCCRRMYLSAVISASKYLLDRFVSNRAWGEIFRVQGHQVSLSEALFLLLMDYRLYATPADLYSAVNAVWYKQSNYNYTPTMSLPARAMRSAPHSDAYYIYPSI